MKTSHEDKTVKHWEERKEGNWRKFQFNQPYGKGLRRLKEDVLSKTNFDPAVLWQWGTMQAMAVLEILKNVEREYGEEGQKLIYDSMWRVGYDIGRQITEGTEIPEGMTDVEWISYFLSVINRIAYGCLETSDIDDGDSAHYHIDWCPHQDHYGPMDCRVQRYFIQGMMDAASEFAREKGYGEIWDLTFKKTIPSGGETCLFEIRRGDPKAMRTWAEYTRKIDQKALDIARREKDEE